MTTTEKKEFYEIFGKAVDAFCLDHTECPDVLECCVHNYAISNDQTKQDFYEYAYWTMFEDGVEKPELNIVYKPWFRPMFVWFMDERESRLNQTKVSG